MRYLCNSCSQTIDAEQTLFFCPFCGKTYGTAGQENRNVSMGDAMHIVLDADSRRAIQERYWKLSRQAVNDALMELLAGIPRFLPQKEADEQKEETLDKNATDNDKWEPDESDWLALRDCTSFAVFRKRLDSLLKAMQRELTIRESALMQIKEAMTNGRAQETLEQLRSMVYDESLPTTDEQIIDIHREEEFIHDFCGKIAIAMGCPSPESLRPTVNYAPEDSLYHLPWADMENIKLPEKDDAYSELLLTLQQSKPALLHALEENGMTVLSVIHYRREKAPKPNKYSQCLRILAAKDYDAIFGDSPEEFIETYSMAALATMQFITTLPTGPDWHCLIEDEALQEIFANQRELIEANKQKYLKQIVYRWESILTVQLDRAYQAQQTDMMEICEEIHNITNSLD